MGRNSIGRRLEKRRMASTFRFVWDGNVLLHETFKKDTSENTELTSWVFEGFVPTAKLVNGKAYSIISDHLGTSILAVDSEGNEVWNRLLDIYGRVRKEYKHSSLGDDVRPFIPFLYQGQYYDEEIGLAYNRFRYYSPESGTYISQDPIGLLGGNPTLYAYVGDKNWWVDVFGLDGNFLFRGTTEGYLGGRATQEIGITPTSTDPRIATIFANNSSKHGTAIVQIFNKEDIDSSKILERNTFDFEKEVGINMLPNDLSKLSSLQISAKDATSILREMGYNIPSNPSLDQLSSIFKELEAMDDKKINDFVDKAKKKICK